MSFRNKYSSYFRYVVLGLSLLFLSIIVINVESRFDTRYLLIPFFILALSGFLILPDYYRAFWDKDYLKNYTPLKDLRRMIIAIVGLVLIGAAITVWVYLNMLILALVLLGLASIPVIYTIVLFVIDDINLSKHITHKKHGVLWFITSVAIAATILLIRYIILRY